MLQNFLFPDFGKAKMPYARTVRSAKKLHGVKPDAGMLFDLLQARSSETFKENEAGISSMFLYHADILIHGKLSLISLRQVVKRLGSVAPQCWLQTVFHTSMENNLL